MKYLGVSSNIFEINIKKGYKQEGIVPISRDTIKESVGHVWNS